MKNERHSLTTTKYLEPWTIQTGVQHSPNSVEVGEKLTTFSYDYQVPRPQASTVKLCTWTFERGGVVVAFNPPTFCIVFPFGHHHMLNLHLQTQIAVLHLPDIASSAVTTVKMPAPATKATKRKRTKQQEGTVRGDTVPHLVPNLFRDRFFVGRSRIAPESFVRREAAKLGLRISVTGKEEDGGTILGCFLDSKTKELCMPSHAFRLIINKIESMAQTTGQPIAIRPVVNLLTYARNSSRQGLYGVCRRCRHAKKRSRGALRLSRPMRLISTASPGLAAP